VRAMQVELNLLETKLAQLVQVTKRMREENHQLRQDLAEALSHARQSDDKINNAKTRLENILAKLPDEKS
jgi:cell division septum initiation protein DivIVA